MHTMARAMKWFGTRLAVLVVASAAAAQDAPSQAPPADGAHLRVMTYNLRYANPGDGTQYWPNRLHAAVSVFNDYAPAVAGTQEGLLRQLEDLAKALPDYRWLGREREAGSEHCAIFYDARRLAPLEHDTLWLSDTPRVPGSRSWGNQLPRIVTWARFEERASGRRFVMVNTHLDHQSEPARQAGIKMIRTLIRETFAGEPVILTGDFNSGAGGEVHRLALCAEAGPDCLPLADAWEAAPSRAGSEGTFHGFRGEPGPARIDWILFNAEFRALRAETVNRKYGEHYPSDHYPVVADLAPLPHTAPAAPATPLPGSGPDAGKTVIYRDSWGVPHIYAPTVEAGLYAMGWAQAEDRPEELLKNLLRGMGECARAEGPSAVPGDMRARMWDLYGVSQRNIDSIRPDVRSHLAAFVRGMNDYYAAHPADLPAWWGDRPIDEAMSVAFARLFLYNWSFDDAYDDLYRGGIQPGFDRTERGSNQWAVAPSRTAIGAAILLIDPHLSWFGPSRFWEFRIHAGPLEGSGFTLPGVPYIGLGHNADLAWAMTTGGPDTADVYELTLNDARTQYLYDGQWRDLDRREVRLDIRGGPAQTHTLLGSHHGPIIALRGGKAYAARSSYADVVNGNEAWFHLNFARDYRGAVAALETQTLFPQNVMVADTSGNIYYQRTGRVPVRPGGHDWSRPVDGSTSATAWQGLHPPRDLVELLNPPRGYMQNCNIPPDAMLVDSPLQPDTYVPYIFGSLGYGPRGGWTNQRGARAVEILDGNARLTIEQAIACALDVHPYGVERWIAVLKEADARFGAAHRSDPAYAAGIDDILGWDQQLEHSSTGALKYFYWRQQLVDDHGEENVRQAQRIIDQHYAVVRGETPALPRLTDDELEAAASSFARAMARLAADFGSRDATYGQRFRVGRDDASWPVGGGGNEQLGMTTLRNIGYGPERDDHTQWGRGGQTSTQIVALTRPIQSWTAPPIGQSDRPDSPHYRDQAEKLFSPRRMKPTWWRPEELAPHIASREELPRGHVQR